MKRVLKTVVERLTGAKMHANHTQIKGQKSGGARDGNGKDWKKDNTNTGLN